MINKKINLIILIITLFNHQNLTCSEPESTEETSLPKETDLTTYIESQKEKLKDHPFSWLNKKERPRVAQRRYYSLPKTHQPIPFFRCFSKYDIESPDTCTECRETIRDEIRHDFKHCGNTSLCLSCLKEHLKIYHPHVTIPSYPTSSKK